MDIASARPGPSLYLALPTFTSGQAPGTDTTCTHRSHRGACSRYSPAGRGPICRQRSSRATQPGSTDKETEEPPPSVLSTLTSVMPLRSQSAHSRSLQISWNAFPTNLTPEPRAESLHERLEQAIRDCTTVWRFCTTVLALRVQCYPPGAVSPNSEC